MKLAPWPAAGDSAGLPAVLVNPPWLAPRMTRSKPLALAPLPHPLDAQRQPLPKKKQLPKRRPSAVRVIKPGNEDIIDAGNVALAARIYANGKAERDMAHRWLLANPERAAYALIAPALGKAGTARENAIGALRMLAASGHAALLLDVADRYADHAVRAAMRAMLDEDPFERYFATVAPLPAFWKKRGAARPHLASTGMALPDDAIERLGVMLRFPRSHGIYPGIVQVQQACTPASLADFAWDLFNAWLRAGGDIKENWAFTSLGLLGNDDVARKLTPLIRAWPGRNQHGRAAIGVLALAAIGTDTALMLLNGIAQKVRFKALQDKAREQIEQVAAARRLSADELEDRLAPDLGLDQQGTLLLDFGARQFRVGFDEALKPYVRDAAGARLPGLPKPNRKDKAALAKAAVARFKLLKQDARTIAAQQVRRLELAMCAQRRWQPEVFVRLLACHPLVRHLVRRLVLGVYELEPGASDGGRLLACFRVGPDGATTTAGDDEFLPPACGNLHIGIPHALDLPPMDAAAFGQLFADYELLQPFAQIGRDTRALSKKETMATSLLRWQGVVVPTGRVLGLANKGWRRGTAQDGGSIVTFNKPLADGRLAELHITPGIIAGLVHEYPQQTLKKVVAGTLSTLDPVAASELIRDLEFLRA
ncbi:DUF4132 domain-containing protein [Massilia sp. CCM 8733]|uniref:DUF4132 domain-containing protein n=1 Tax=Massilia mucilaginosa TaxID=2609282 RepID=A0ABX0NP61_9BURK|nr:DUF4132 domain-containing protein [Massilia mucilaginosa]NHZ88570.1 DUF4132 domain-containing protein [Massilia mucilaginosa]